MSRSNPTINNPNPSTRWHEWDGSQGGIKYYDKELKQDVSVPIPFTFILLDQLATIKGWHDASQSGIFANEVRDTTCEPFIVKAFKGGTLAEGIYRSIKDKVIVSGGVFTANLYIAYKDGGDLKIGSLQFKGAALNAWVEFTKVNRSDLYSKSIKIAGMVAGKKGSITFQTPEFQVNDISEDTNRQALGLDIELQNFLKGYFSRKTNDQASHEEEKERTYVMQDTDEL